ncbi:MAG: hypothetical protein KGJ62_07010 [Armatimonadetes bacterium]|nr:hypothetical protein [Armatimonadota bacterium]MDE2207381.1 hypothetical protein [Armatimonadota bacterium]
MARVAAHRWIAISAALLAVGGFAWGRRVGFALNRPGSRFHSLARLISKTGAELGLAGLMHQDPSSTPPEAVYEIVLDRVQHQYVHPEMATDSRLTKGALTAMVASLDDPATWYMDGPARINEAAMLSGTYHGIGADLEVRGATATEYGSKVAYSYLTVMDLAPSGPAARAGLHAGDRITDIGKHWIISYSPLVDYTHLQDEERQPGANIQKIAAEAKIIEARFISGYLISKAMSMLTTGAGTSYSIRITRDGKTVPSAITITTGVTTVQPVVWRNIDPHTAYLQVRQFDGAAKHAWGVALDAIGRSNARNLVIDLRGNPGGVWASTTPELDGLGAERALLARLTAGGPEALLATAPKHTEPFSIPVSQSHHFRIAVLVDGGTSNLAELAAVALRHAGARIVGSRTFGDPVIRRYEQMANGAGIEIAWAHVRTQTGASIASGVTPDVLLAADLVDTEGALQRAASVLEAA